MSQSWIFIGRTDAEDEAPILWPPDAKSWFIRKDLDAGKEWRQEENGTIEDEMFGWHHWLNGHEFEQTLGDGGGQGGLAYCSPWGQKNQTWPSDWTTTMAEGGSPFYSLLWFSSKGPVLTLEHKYNQPSYRSMTDTARKTPKWMPMWTEWINSVIYVLHSIWLTETNLISKRWLLWESFFKSF